MITFLKIILPLYLMLFFGIAIFWRSYLAWKHTGVNPYVFGKDDSVYNYVGKLFRFILVATVVIVVVFSLVEAVYSFFLPILWLDSIWFKGIGLALLMAALIWVLIAQVQVPA